MKSLKVAVLDFQAIYETNNRTPLLGTGKKHRRHQGGRNYAELRQRQRQRGSPTGLMVRE
jgi:hypothetical protein